MLLTGQEQKKTCFFNLLVQTSGRIWTVVDRGYFLKNDAGSPMSTKYSCSIEKIMYS